MMSLEARASARIGSEADAATARQHWLAVLARARLSELESAWDGLAEKPAYSLLRPTETGLAMVRGRVGGSGQPFNLGEMTMTRAAVQLRQPGGKAVTGFAHVAGRQARRAELVAIFDALLQLSERRDAVAERVIAPLAARQSADKAAFARKIAASKVEFFTVVRGS
jgi:alpha-D-ribose 1-methylphosphonate 5-triphosphate synthase subunit PhnG